MASIYDEEDNGPDTTVDDTGPAVGGWEGGPTEANPERTPSRALTPEESAAYAKQDAGRGAQSDGGPLPPGGLSATIQGGRMYDPSGREVASIGETVEQAAARFGAQLPMSQREMQKLDQLRSSYNEVLHNPNLAPKDKFPLLNAMAREIHFGQTRLQYMQAQQRMEGRQERGAAQAEGTSHALAQQSITAESMATKIAEMEKRFPGYEFHGDPRHGISMKPRQAKPDHAAEQGVKERQKVWDAAGKNYQQRLKEWKANESKGPEPTFDESMQRAQEDHGREKAFVHGTGPTNPAAQDPAAQSGGGRPAGASIEEQRGSLIESRKQQVEAIQKIENPAERNHKLQAAQSLTTILHENLGKPITPAVAAEIQRLKHALASPPWPAAAKPPTSAERSRNEDNANAYAGGT